MNLNLLYMKRILFLLLFPVLMVSALSAQDFKPAEVEELAAIYLHSELEGVQNVTGEQIKKLVPIVVSIDKQYPFLTNYRAMSRKKMAKKRLSILVLEEKLYAQVLTKDQMRQLQPSINKEKEKYMAIIQKKK